ncbi:PIG-L family deacetylase [Nocardioides sp.]|uniref:PIG-L deacetylase family protein n=1 Tax=Nocardioides sp. TaxID=35761 RepID=UPI002639D76E|nr:PIG-L family deacetylase [Nocardioides sp.]
MSAGGHTPRGRVARRASYTVVSLHAHPDDEALLTAGTLARAVAEGHRVVLVVATDGEAGLAGDDLAGARLAAARRAELEASAAAIGACAVHFLGYGDSGFDPAPEAGADPVVTELPTLRGPAGTESFAATDVEVAAQRVAAILRQEQADVLTIYDAQGGYGHPDHVQVHHVGLLAAELAGTPVVLEATIDRDLLARAARALRRISALVPVPAMPELDHAFLPRSEITHRVDVRGHLSAKVASLRAHHSQSEGGTTVRTLALLLRLPGPLRRRVLGTEWFREVGRDPSGPMLDDIFASLGTGSRRPFVTVSK